MPRTPALVAALTAALIGVGTVPPAGAAPAAEQSVDRSAARATLRAPANVVGGERITLTGTQKLGRVKLKLQRRAGTRWVAAGSARRAAKRYKFSLTVPRKSRGTLRFRVQARVGRKLRTVATARTPVVKQQLRAASTAPRAATSTAFTASLTPVRPGRTVVVQEHLDGVWRTVGAAGKQRTARVRQTLTTAGYPTWYRLRASAWKGLPALTTTPVRSTLSRVPTAIAHRAGANLGPEQTLVTMDRALAAGAGSMEVDVQLTKDEVPVIVHDTTWNRTTDVETVFPDKLADGQTKIADLTWEQVQQLDASSWWPGHTGPVQRIPSLEQWLEHLDQRAELVLEIKDPEVAGNANLVTKLDELMQPGQPLRELADAGKLTVSSFGVEFFPAGPNQAGLDALKHFHDLHLGVQVGYLTFGISPAAVPQWADQVHPSVAFISRADVLAQQALGRTVSVWTASNLASTRASVATGADRVITDDPRLLTRVLNPPRPR